MAATHSKYFAEIKEWFELGIWNEKRVKNAVAQNYLTEAEYKEITGKTYKAA